MKMNRYTIFRDYAQNMNILIGFQLILNSITFTESAIGSYPMVV